MDVKGPKHWEDILHTGFSEESDRACVILAAALLDSALEILLKTHLVPSSSGSDPLFDNVNAPLSDFNSKIELAYRVGLISHKFARDLHLVRKIRNSFAHDITGCSFAHSAVRNRITELSRSNGISSRVPLWREGLPDGPKGDFMISISWMQWHLRLLVEDTESLNEEEIEWGYIYIPDSPKKLKKK